jgi:uncharacterized RDD family membrane protein YckC
MMIRAQEYWDDYEVLTIETPEMLELRLPLAGFGPRALAWLIDNIIIGVSIFILIMIAMFTFWDSIFRGSGGTDAVLPFFIIVLLLAILSPVFYFVVFETLWNGQTPGKRWLGIRVVRRGGLPLGFSQIMTRNLIRIIDLLPSNGMIGLVSFFATRFQQRLGDLAADTVVIREFQAGREPGLWHGTPEALALRPQAQGALTQALAYTTASYLQRASQLDNYSRLQITDALIKRLGYSAATLSLRERDNYLASLIYQDSRSGGV